MNYKTYLTTEVLKCNHKRRSIARKLSFSSMPLFQLSLKIPSWSNFSPSARYWFISLLRRCALMFGLWSGTDARQRHAGFFWWCTQPVQGERIDTEYLAGLMAPNATLTGCWAVVEPPGKEFPGWHLWNRLRGLTEGQSIGQGRKEELDITQFTYKPYWNFWENPS